MLAALLAVSFSVIAAIIYDSLPTIALRMAKLATALTPMALREEVDPYADTAAAVQAIEPGGETRFSVLRLAAGALFVAVPRLVILHVAVRVQVAMFLRQARNELEHEVGHLDRREPVQPQRVHADPSQGAALGADFHEPPLELIAIVRAAYAKNGRRVEPEAVSRIVSILLTRVSKRRLRKATAMGRKQCRALLKATQEVREHALAEYHAGRPVGYERYDRRVLVRILRMQRRRARSPAP